LRHQMSLPWLNITEVKNATSRYCALLGVQFLQLVSFKSYCG
jgi:hypothetical protein